MRSSTFLKFSGALFVVTLLALGLSQGTTLAGPLIQVTTAATSAAVSFPPCPPAGGATTSAATGAATGATMSATESAAGGATEAAGAATANPPGYIGIRVVTVDSCGVRILEILPDTPAATAGLKAEDVIVAVNGTAFTGSGQLRQMMNNYHAGDKLQLTVQRAGTDVVVSVTLAAPPANFPPTVAAPPSAGTAATSSAGETSPTTPAATPAATTQ